MIFYFNSTRGHTGSLLVFNTRVVGGEDGNLHAVSPVSNSICPQRFEMQVCETNVITPSWLVPLLIVMGHWHCH